MSPSPSDAVVQPPFPRRWWQAGRRGLAHTLFVGTARTWAYAGGGREPAPFATVSEWAEAHAGDSVRVVLSGALTHQVVVDDPALPLRHADALAAWARHQFTHYHGSQASHWPVATWLDGEQRGASVAHGLDLPGLMQLAKVSGVQVRAVQPWWAVALRTGTLEAPTLALADRAELWMAEGRHVTRVRCAAGRVQGIEAHWLATADAPALAALLHRVMGDAALDEVKPWVMGHGIAGALDGVPVRRLGALDGPCPEAFWVGAA